MLLQSTKDKTNQYNDIDAKASFLTVILLDDMIAGCNHGSLKNGCT